MHTARAAAMNDGELALSGWGHERWRTRFKRMGSADSSRSADPLSRLDPWLGWALGPHQTAGPGSASAPAAVAAFRGTSGLCRTSLPVETGAGYCPDHARTPFHDLQPVPERERFVLLDETHKLMSGADKCAPSSSSLGQCHQSMREGPIFIADDRAAVIALSHFWLRNGAARSEGCCQRSPLSSIEAPQEHYKATVGAT